MSAALVGQEAIRKAKLVVRDYHCALDAAEIGAIGDLLRRHVSSDYSWRGSYPLGEGLDAEQVQVTVLEPLWQSFPMRQWRRDIFFAGHNDAGDPAEVWTCSMGHLMGLFDRPWLGIRPTGRIASLRFAEFHQVRGDRIVQTGLFLDVIGLMQQAGYNPLPPATGSYFVYPGPRTHDGLLFGDSDPDEGTATLKLLNHMVADLDALNRSGQDRCPPEYLARTWHADMVWYGPAGIGASMSIPRYQIQHQYPFREGLTDKVYHGHVARLAEGTYAGFFGWPNLTNRSTGGFLGLPASGIAGEMRVVDIYRREGDRLAENWVFIDFPWYLKQQGLDVFARMRELG